MRTQISADAHMVLAATKETEWDWAGAEREYQRSIELNPSLARAHHWYAFLLVNMNRPNEAITEAQRAVDLDPLTDRIYVIEAEIYYLAHQNDRADQILAMLGDPAKHSILVHHMLGKTALAKSAYPDAIHEFLTTSKEEPDEPNSWALLAYAYAQGGQRREALEAFAKLNQLSRRRYVAPYWTAVAWIGLATATKP